MFNLGNWMESGKKIKNLKNIHTNEVAVLVGSGPSIFEENTKKFFEKANKEKYMYFTNNQACFLDTDKKMFKTDYHLTSDDNALKKSTKDILNFNPNKMKIAAFRRDLCINQKLGLGFKSKHEVYNKYNFCDLGNKNNIILEGFANPCLTGLQVSSIFITLQIILYTGIKKIYLVGCDCNSGNSITKEHAAPYQQCSRGWGSVYSYLKSNYPKIDIQVVSPKGLKNIIPEYKP